MNTYKRHRFPPVVISYSVWLYYRFNLSHRDIEDLLAERGIIVTRESIRLWCIEFGALRIAGGDAGMHHFLALFGEQQRDQNLVAREGAE